MSEPKNAEDLVIEFENKRGDKFSIFRGINGDWIIMSDKEGMIHARFKLLEQAKKCAEILKESV